jgi:uncharacterized protein (DUF2147 family)
MSLGRKMPSWGNRTTALAILASSAALVAPAASADHRHPLSKVKGKWTNPVGACVAHIIKVDPTTGDLLSCSGTSDWTGTWKGSTKWTLTGDVSLTTGGSGRIDEVFKGRARDGRKGRLTFREHFTLDAAGNIDIKGKIVKSSGKLEGSHGGAHWIGTANADGSGNGTYSGRWHEGRKRPHKQQHHS